MDWLAVAAIFGLFLLLVIMPVIVIFRAHQRARDKAVAEFARSIGMSHAPALPGEHRNLIASGGRPWQSAQAELFLRPFLACPLFGSGSNRGVENIISGTRWGLSWLIFDYRRRTGARHSQRERDQRTCVIVSCGRQLGSLSIEPRIPLIGRLMTMVNPRDVIQTGEPEFDSRFIVRATDRSAAMRVLRPPMRRYLLSLYRGPRKWYRMAWTTGNSLIVAESGRASARHVADMMEIARGFVDRLEDEQPHLPVDG